MVAAVRGRAFNGEEDEAFSFGWDVDRDGAFVVGNGSDEKPFLVGLRRKLCCDKLTETPVPSFSTFHLLCIFVTSQQQEGHFAKVFAALRWIYRKVVGTPLRVHFVMGDADVVQYNALASVFSDCKYIHLINRSIDVRPFSESPGTSKELLSRVKALRGKQLLREFVLPRMSADFLLVDSRNDVFHVLYTPPNRIYNTTSNSAHEAIQVSAQPVDMVTQTCPCAYHFKYTNCVHRIFAMQERARIDSNGDDVLVNRRVSKRKRAAIGPAPVAAGRPSLVGPALQLE
ncbi:hypothetical protein L917_08277 [Phytophthora nicotianae]|uniref:SWIM-type domain-containing protein n=1 Tax=Phytophthora nicotianae TaxID=4792 RepID=W2L848_PHYNI|nr:hypothetical protein L917_08277 [Phytophthora nicotianae]